MLSLKSNFTMVSKLTLLLVDRLNFLFQTVILLADLDVNDGIYNCILRVFCIASLTLDRVWFLASLL